MTFEWTELAYLELQAGNTAMHRLRLRGRDGVPGAGGPVRELVAAAGGHPGRADVPAQRADRRDQRQCWRITSLDINIFTQIGFVVLVGLASKNAILIVEFAKENHGAGQAEPGGDARGLPAAAAADPDDVVRVHPRRACPALDRPRGRRRDAAALGTAVFSGMLGVTLLRHLPDAGVLLRHRQAERVVASSARRWCGASAGSCSGIVTLELPLAAVALAALDTAARRPRPVRPGQATRRARARRNGSEGLRVFALLHRPADLRRGAVDRHHAGRAASRVFTLPVAQYPEITPPTVEVSAIYPGANAQVVADTVAAPIEQQVNGVEDMMYMSSQCTNDGTYTLTVTFKPGADLNMAQVLVQNRVVAGRADAARRGQAPRRDGQEEVAQRPDDRQPVLAGRQPRQPLPEQLRHDPDPGRAGAAAAASATSPTSASATTACGVWLDPEKMAVPQPDRRRRGHAPSQQQNVQVAAGQIGQPPVPNGPGLPVHDDHAGPARRRRAVRRHHPQDRRRRAASSACSDVGRHRTGRPGLRPDLHARRQAVGRAGGLPAARLQRAGDGRAGPRARWRS